MCPFKFDIFLGYFTSSRRFLNCFALHRSGHSVPRLWLNSCGTLYIQVHRYSGGLTILTGGEVYNYLR